MDDEKWIELEIKLAHQEKLIKDLSASMYAQQKEIDGLKKLVTLMKDRVKAFAAPEDSPREILDEKPPHY